MRNKPMRSTLLGLAALLSAASGAGAQNVEKAIDRAVTAHRGIKTARGTFEMIVTNPATRSTYTSRGEFHQRLPNEMALIFSDPKDDVLVSDGTAIWMYFPSTLPGRALKLPLGPSVGSLDLLGRFLDTPHERYNITAAGSANVSGRGTTVATLVPKQPMDEFESATVWIDDADGLIRQFEVKLTRENGGQTRRFRFVTFTPNATVNPAVFKFTPPKGVVVEDRTRG